MINKLQGNLSIFCLALLMFFANYSKSQEAQIDFTYNGSCVGSPTTIVGTATGFTPTTWEWDFGDGNTATGQNVVNVFNAPNSLGYPVKLIAHDGHTLLEKIKFIRISDLPIADFSFANNLCSADSVHFQDLSHGAPHIIQHVWIWDDGSPNDTINFPDNPSIKHKFPESNTYVVTLQVMTADSCVNTVSKNVTIENSPTANFHFDGKCANAEVLFTDASSSNGGGEIAYWTWFFDDPSSGSNNTSILQSPTHIFTLPGTYNVKLVVQNFNMCTDTIIKQVIINDKPPVSFTYTTPCLNELLEFTPDTTVMDLSQIASYLWDFGGGITATSQVAYHKFLTSGTYPVKLTVTDLNGCQNDTTINVKVNELPQAAFSVVQPHCAGNAVVFDEHSQVFFGHILEWIWNFGDGSPDLVIPSNGNPNATHVYADAGDYQVTLIVKTSDGCQGQVTHTVTISPNPIANFTYTGTCQNVDVQFTDLSQTNGGGSISYLWNFGDPHTISNTSVLQNPVHKYSQSGNYTVTLIVTNAFGCVDTTSQDITITEKPAVDFAWDASCLNQPILFSPDTNVVDVANVQSWLWTFDDGTTSNLQQSTHAFTTPGAHLVTLKITNNDGCSNEISHTVNIIPKPTVSFTHSNTLCKDSEVTFTPNTVSQGIVNKWEWSFGDGTPLLVVNAPDNPIVTHTYTNHGQFTVKLTVTTEEGCFNSYESIITISNNPTVNFNFQHQCQGEATLFTDLSQPGSGAISSWLWNFDDAPSGASNSSQIANPSHIFTAAQTYNVILTVVNSLGCKGSVTKPVEISPKPFVDFTYEAGCQNDTIKFKSSDLVPPANVTSYLWTFSDGTTANIADPIKIFANSGTQSATLKITDNNGCENSITKDVIVNTPPVANFSISDIKCANTEVHFTDLSSSAQAGQITKWTWTFGDATPPTVVNAPASPNVSHEYVTPATYTVKLDIRTALGCEASKTQTVSIKPRPDADFTFENTCQDAPVSFTNTSNLNGGSSITNYAWNFGDPSSVNNTSNVQNPTHTYSLPNTYNVLLKITNSDLCWDTVTKPVAVTGKPAVGIVVDGACQGDVIHFTPDATVMNIADITSFVWSIDNGTLPYNGQDFQYTFNQSGNYTVTLTVTDINGCINSASVPLQIKPKPNAEFNFVSNCENTATQFTDVSFTVTGEPIVEWHWEFGDGGATSTLQNPTHVFSGIGSYSVTLIVKSYGGCFDTITKPVEILRQPTANFTYTNSPCNDAAIYFHDSSFAVQATIVDYLWIFDANHTSPEANPVFVFPASGDCYDVSLIVTNNLGCSDTITKEVCVEEGFNFEIVANTTCHMDTTFFTAEVLSGNDSIGFYKWDFGDPESGANNTSTLAKPFHIFTQPDLYTVTLVATNVENCIERKTIQVRVLPAPIADFSFTQEICDTTIFFKDLSTMNGGSKLVMWKWEFGDGDSLVVNAPQSPNTSHQYAMPGVVDLKLTTYNLDGCKSVKELKDVLIKPCVQAEFVYDTNVICQNYVMTFIDSSFSGTDIVEWYWDFGDNTQSTYYQKEESVTHIYNETGSFTVKLRVTASIEGQTFSDSIAKIIKVLPTPIADFRADSLCFNMPVKFTNLSTTEGSAIVGYSWTFDNPSNTSDLKNPRFKFSTPGYHNVNLIVTNSFGCKDTIIKEILINNLPTADFTVENACAGQKVIFTDNSVQAESPIEFWRWRFAKPDSTLLGSSTTTNPEFTFYTGGTHQVSLVVSDSIGCSDTINKQVEIFQSPISAFSITPNFGDIQGQVEMKNLSIGANEYIWDFGNGETSSGFNPVVYYQDPGSYEITLIAITNESCADTSVYRYEFIVKGLYVPSAFVPDSPNKELQKFKPVGINLKKYEVSVFDRWGNLLWQSDELNAKGMPTEGWDGTYNGKPVQGGVYTWKISAMFIDGTTWNAVNIGNQEGMNANKWGTVTVIR